MDGYLSVFGDILDTLRSIERKVSENSKAIANLEEKLSNKIEETKTELRTELKAEIKANREDIINQTSELATEIIELIEDDSNQTKKRVERLELAVFHETCKVCEDGETYECK